MLEILAQVQWEQTGTVVVAVIAALGGQKGLEKLIVAWRGRQAGSSNDCGAVGPRTCPEHGGLVKLLDERHESLLRGMTKIEQSVERVHERLDEIVRT